MDHGTAVGPPSGRKAKTIELAVFLFLILPTMGASFLMGRQSQIGFVTTAVISILNDLGLISLVFYFVWRNGESIRALGWRFEHTWREIGWGVLLFVPAYTGTQLLESALRQAGISQPGSLPSFLAAGGGVQIALAFVLVVVVAVVEETIFRGYLILRFNSAVGNATAAVLLSTAVFAVGHGYEGLAGLIGVVFLGLVLALIYLWRESLVAPMVMHFLTDFISLVLSAVLRASG